MIDLSPFNKFVQQTPFKMETASSVLLSVRKGDFLASIDLKDAYFQIPVHVSSRKWLRFISNGMVHQFKVLCFGLSTAPQVFTRIFAAVTAWAHACGVRLLRYLDDWLVLASTEARARQHVRDLLSLCNSLGVVLNREKSELNPSQLVVLNSLTAAPYEPLKDAEERLLAHKTLFLLALASAKRVGELHALSHSISHSAGWREVSFSFVPGFVAKTQDLSSHDPRYEGFTVPALPKSRDSSNGRLLCPVRTQALPDPHRPTPTVLRTTVCCLGTHQEGDLQEHGLLLASPGHITGLPAVGKTPPDFLSLSTGDLRYCPVPPVQEELRRQPGLKAGTWRRHTTFTRHYLRDLSHKSLDTFHLGPVVAAQAMV